MVKRPDEISVYPLDVKKDVEGGGLWFYVPAWIVRAYHLRDYGTNAGKIKFVIKANNRAMFEYSGEEKGKEYYFSKNWYRKIILEERKADKQKRGLSGAKKR